MELPRGGKWVRLSVYWPDDWKQVTLDPEDWESVLAGKALWMEGEGYWYDGEEFQDTWHFAGGLEGELIVTYGDGGEGFVGSLKDAEIEEVDEEAPP